MWLRKVYLKVLRDFAAAQYMAAMSTCDLASHIKHAKPGESVGHLMARRSYDAADALIQYRETK